MGKDDKYPITKSHIDNGLDILSLITSCVPWVGGPISNVLGGFNRNRKFARVEEVLKSLANDIKDWPLTSWEYAEVP